VFCQLVVTDAFMSMATPIGFEFVVDAQGKVTHLLAHGASGDRKLTRKSSAPAQRE